MSEENVQLFMAATDAFNRADVGAFLELVHPEIRFEPLQAALQGAYLGHQGVRDWFADISEHYVTETWHVDYTHVRDLGGDVLGIGTLRFSARGSGITSETPVAFRATFSQRLITHLKDFRDEDSAIEAA